ncbi:polyadenylate-binding protein-interacting protein 1-like [Mercenaria mercenaria]|uniref:polyadenylate-binding protein-interacting protein 1-like n=1 Tax=Mercenaria mercenaria TaxID=6596 RepID=UPI00234F02F2|nr:polyadenylate-binding protein-interacting protein 1-like [Mercenaria mercenaria]
MSSDSTAGSSGGSSPEKSRKLRRPHPSTQERLRNGEFDPNQNTAPVMKSKLSADAPEFVPKFAYIQPDQQQDALYQDFQRLVSIRPSHLSAVTTTGPSGNDSIADIFKDAVFSLTSNPAPMEEYMKRITDQLNQGVSDPTVIQDIIETLLEQSISEPNFRFTGAKICKLLSHQLKSHPVFNNFRSTFLNRIKAEFDKREELLNSNVERLCGLSMFFGELFLVLEVEQKDTGVMIKIGILRNAISDLLRTLLSQPDDVTVKCATQLLKLTGTALMETTDLTGNFDDIFNKIKSLEKHPQLNKTSHCLINSVLSRLEYNFGVGQQPSPQKPVQAYPGQQSTSFNNEPIFYNTEGQPITREEAGYSDIEGLNSEEQEAFLQWEAENYANQQWVDQGGDGYVNEGQWSDQGTNGYVQQPWSTGMSDYTQWSTDQDQGFGFNESEYYGDYSSDMDDEMAAAYEMFLKESGQSRH